MKVSVVLRSFVILCFAVGASAQDAQELLARGTALTRTKPADAIKVLQQALQLDPHLPGLRYQLGLAFHAIGDEADAESELREAVALTPDSAPAHNYLGIALFQLGNAKAALDEFRVVTKLTPSDPNAHFNLAEAMARTGDTANAVEELRVAAGLAPTDDGLARLVKVVETALATPESTIKVDVRQVLVPVVVTDSEGRHMTGLTQEKFRVFEDGVEQKITAFSVESSTGSEAPAAAKPEAKAPAAVVPGAVAQPPVRRTYFVIIDTLHQTFNNFVSAREALAKLFREERSEDSQYVVVALGASPQIVQNVTRDPGAVLAVLESKKMQKIFLDGQQGGFRAETERYMRDLSETRTACDLFVSTGEMPFQVKCEAGKRRAPEWAEQIAELDRTVTREYLRQLGNLVAQLSRGRDRRTMVLVSGGFEIVPGREAYDLLTAFFPDLAKYGMRATERMQDAFEPILQLAARSNITIDTIDSRGLYGQQAFDASSPGLPLAVDAAVGRVQRNVAAARGNTLAEIAEATGGTAFHDNNNLLLGMQRAFADGRDYYTLAYVSSNAAVDRKFRTITVKVKESGAVVNAKKGYWPAAPAQ